MKTCATCQEPKPSDQFHRQAEKRDGLAHQCKPCANARRAAYRLANIEKERERNRAWNKSSGGREYLARWRADNPDYGAEWRASNPEYAAAYQAENPHIGWEGLYRRRARAFGFEPVVHRFTRDELIARYGEACVHCGGPFEQLDHYPTPVIHGGAHSLDNCAPSCASCNANSWRTSTTEMETLNV